MNRSIAGRHIVVGAALLLAAGGARLMAADDLPKAETLIDKYIEATGGKAAYQKNHSTVMTGTMELAARGIKGTLTVYEAAPDKNYTEINFEGIGKYQEGSDGKVAWRLSAMGAELKDGDEKAQALLQGRFNGDLFWKELYKTAETTGVESVDGRDCYKIVMTPNEGSPITRYQDKQTNLMVKVTMTAKAATGDLPFEQTVGDYRKEGDLLVPHKKTQKAAGQEIVFTVVSVKYNPDIPKDKFELPDEIKALVNKK